MAPLYRERGINLFVADYRGYGASDGSPGCAALIADSHPLYGGFRSFLRDQGSHGGGRALLTLSGAPEKNSLFIAGAGHNDLFDRALDRSTGVGASFTGARSTTSP